MKKNSKHSQENGQQNKDVHSPYFYSNIVLSYFNQSMKEIKGIQIKTKLSRCANDVILYIDTTKILSELVNIFCKVAE